VFVDWALESVIIIVIREPAVIQVTSVIQASKTASQKATQEIIFSFKLFAIQISISDIMHRKFWEVAEVKVKVLRSSKVTLTVALEIENGTKTAATYGEAE
jgi:hypothetical protein